MHEAILKRLNRQGPVRIWVTEEEYACLRASFRRLLLRRPVRRWDEEDRLIALGFFRGYTLYREIPEHENQFWRSLFAELDIDAVYPSRDQFNELWNAFSWHQTTRPYLVQISNRRMLAETVNRIFGVRGLRANHLEGLLRRYLEVRARKEDPEVAAWLEEVPSLAQLVHHAENYTQIFEGVYLALRAIEQAPALAEVYVEQGVDALIAGLAASGVYFEKPHPVLYLHHKSERLLRELLGARRRAKAIRDSVEVRFLEVRGLEGLEGVRIITNITGETLFAGRKAVGEVQLASGMRKRFFWVPEVDEEGNPLWVAPQDGELEIGFGEERVRLSILLRPKNVVSVLLTMAGSALDWHHREGLTFRLVGGDPGRLRYRLAGSAERKELDALNPRAKDTLLIEYKSGKTDFVLLKKLAVKNHPKLHKYKLVLESRRLVLQIDASLPADGALEARLRTKRRDEVKRLAANRAGYYELIFMFHPYEWGRLELRLEPHGPELEIPIPLQVDWGRLLQRGIGVGQFV